MNNGESLRLSQLARVAVISLLFNWPSTGGGNMHTLGWLSSSAATCSTCGIFMRYPAGGSGGLRTTGTRFGRGGTCGQADGGVGDPRRTGAEGAEMGTRRVGAARETCSRADGGVGDQPAEQRRLAANRGGWRREKGRRPPPNRG